MAGIITRMTKVLAKGRLEAGYESDGITLKIGKTRVLGPFCMDGLHYIDVYEGLDPFEGAAFIVEKSGPLWAVEYKGGITDSRYKPGRRTKMVYDEVLKPALRKFPRDTPWKRGPDELVIGDYKYWNTCEGSMTDFRNKEGIIHLPTRREIYSYEDDGGAV